MNHSIVSSQGEKAIYANLLGFARMHSRADKDIQFISSLRLPSAIMDFTVMSRFMKMICQVEIFGKSCFLVGVLRSEGRKIWGSYSFM